MNKITILDTTLRDGAQGAGVHYSLEDQVQISRHLDDFGVDFIELGQMADGEEGSGLFKRLTDLKNAKLTIFGSTMRKGGQPQADAGLMRLVTADTPAVTIFGKSWKLHVSEVLRCELDENLRLVEQSCAYLKCGGKLVIFDAEHFFDGYLDDPEYASEVLRAAKRGGADIMTLCDTNGGLLPDQVQEIVRDINREFNGPIGVHFHNDSGMAAANSVLSVLEGACHIQGTIGGLGERCGNADLIQVIAGLQIKRGIRCLPPESLPKMSRLARTIAEISNVNIFQGTPYVGNNAFRHKAGMHVDGMLKNTKTFEHIDPGEVGNERRFLPSGISGRALLLHYTKQLEQNFEKDSPELTAIMAEIKEKNEQGYLYEAAEASFELLVWKHIGRYRKLFDLVMLKAFSEHPQAGGGASVLIRIRVDDKETLSAGQGKGPVHALDNALAGALKKFYPMVEHIHLIDYKVRVLNSRQATAAQVRVLITSTDGKSIWTTAGVSEDIILASWQALSSSIEYALLK
ncbi:MAG: citramalate synthase [Oscillospiraceae bacterium]|nr:citramalate synthase [Oscillospiraceae bacterium]